MHGHGGYDHRLVVHVGEEAARVEELAELRGRAEEGGLAAAPPRAAIFEVGARLKLHRRVDVVALPLPLLHTPVEQAVGLVSLAGGHLHLLLAVVLLEVARVDVGEQGRPHRL